MKIEAVAFLIGALVGVELLVLAQWFLDVQGRLERIERLLDPDLDNRLREQEKIAEAQELRQRQRWESRRYDRAGNYIPE